LSLPNRGRKTSPSLILLSTSRVRKQTIPLLGAARSDMLRLVSTSDALVILLRTLPVSDRVDSENDNLRHEYVSIFDQVQRDIPFARIALQKEPDAINMW